MATALDLELMPHMAWFLLNAGSWESMERLQKNSNVAKGAYGIYIIGIKRENDTVRALYLGQAGNIRVRLMTHLVPSRECEQEINKFIQNQDNSSVVFKWIDEEHYKELEGHYLNHVEHTLGYRLLYNIKSGDGAKRTFRPIDKENQSTSSFYPYYDLPCHCSTGRAKGSRRPFRLKTVPPSFYGRRPHQYGRTGIICGRRNHNAMAWYWDIASGVQGTPSLKSVIFDDQINYLPLTHSLVSLLLSCVMSKYICILYFNSVE